MTEKTTLRAPEVKPGLDPPAPAKAKPAPRLGQASARLTTGLGQQWLQARNSAIALVDRLRVRVWPLLVRLSTPLSVVSPLGWTLVVLTLAAGFVGLRLGWIEFSYVAAASGALLALCALFTIGRLRLEVELLVDPVRVRVGETAAAQLRITNIGATPLLPLGIELPVGAAVARYSSPLLVPGAIQEELALIPTERRGVVVLGPVTTQRGDPFGVFRREVKWSEEIELFVHPRTVQLEGLGTGFLRDLEGQTTNEVSMSDLAFHTLRQYVPGDDRRYIHWRSSAKASAAAGVGTFLVRQFLDTRRTHLAVVVDVNASSYRNEAEFEVAISAAASVAMRAITDELDLTIACGDGLVVCPRPFAALDSFARAELGNQNMAETVGRLAAGSPDVSAAIFVTGAEVDPMELKLLTTMFPPEVNSIALQVEEGQGPALRQAGDLSVYGIGSLGDLSRVLVGGVVG